MKKYSIPIAWQSYQRFEIEAENLQDAVKNALDTFFSIPDDKYIEDSFEIDRIIEEKYPDEKYNLDEILK